MWPDELSIRCCCNERSCSSQSDNRASSSLNSQGKYQDVNIRRAHVVIGAVGWRPWVHPRRSPACAKTIFVRQVSMSSPKRGKRLAGWHTVTCSVMTVIQPTSHLISYAHHCEAMHGVCSLHGCSNRQQYLPGCTSLSKGKQDRMIGISLVLVVAPQTPQYDGT